MGARDGHPVEVAKSPAQPQQVVQRQAFIQQPVAADQQQAVVPQPTPGQNLASMYMQAPAAPLAGPADVNPLAVADATPAGLGLLFAQQQMAQREKRKEE